ncbi:MAG: hypothetical protein CSA62_04530 [Planctomycetota bacterium]|nr:MAG: hypothetical protein CSA62_04530 [Planctomycetota bacterium]
MKLAATTLPFALLLLGPALAQASAKNSDAARARILAIARSYATHQWRASPKHVFHGRDPEGVLVNTPDLGYREGGFSTDNSVNVGVPYQWGGAVRLKAFDEGLKKGKYAGHLPANGEIRVSKHAVGVDCSGLISCCWQLPIRQSTRTLGQLSYRLKSFAELLPGDIVNRFDRHVMLFVGFEDKAKSKLRIIEATSPKVRERVVELSALKKQDYVPLRYRPLDSRWPRPKLAKSSMELNKPAETKQLANEKPYTKIEPSDWIFALRDSKLGDWIRYEIVPSIPGKEKALRSFTFGRSSDATNTITLCTELRGERLYSCYQEKPDTPVARRILDFLSINEHFEDLKLDKVESRPSKTLVAGKLFQTEDIKVELSAKLLLRGRRLATVIRGHLVLSPQLPLQGVLSARFGLVVDARKAGGPAKQAQRIRFRLQAYGRR